MANAVIVYNGFAFNPHTSYEVTESYEYDEAEMTVVGTKFTILAKTIIAASPNLAGNPSHTGSDFYAGSTVHAARQKLSKAGGVLEFIHDGFGPVNYLQIN